MRALNGAILAKGARETSARLVLRACRWVRWPSCDMVGPCRAARATLVQRLAGVPQPHEVIDDELKAVLEQIEQTRLAIGAFEDVVLLDPDHREPAATNEQASAGRSGAYFFLTLSEKRARARRLSVFPRSSGPNPNLSLSIRVSVSESAHAVPSAGTAEAGGPTDGRVSCSISSST